jgi:prevent-host-death family protein
VKRISIQDLKPQLSAAIAEAEAGGTIVITRHGTPVAQLGPAVSPHVRRGRAVGEPWPAAVAATVGRRALAVLTEDREGR